MAVFFNCSFARAAVKSYTSDLAVRNQPLTHDGRKKRLERFREQFSFTDAEVTANPQLSSFSAATRCSDRFDQHCARLLSVYNRRWPGRDSAARELRAQWLEQFKPAVWNNLPRLQQLSHDIHDCYTCAQQFPRLHSAFPVRASTTPQNNITSAVSALSKKINSTKASTSEKAAKQTAKFVLQEIQQQYQE